ncbi:hypothetical protein HOLleu_37623 [Holothuria leucospilota]|uniref:Uncharacterized protein n=1 Tax=Holothuria leucospilota TaxID=206669 RepID=A0A9Q0YIB2_HOLLE|nr:hypothetical protein HOLleu_37623 [Holothuria leucospilota]
MIYFDHVTMFLLVNCEIQGKFFLALRIICNSYVQNVFRGACNAMKGDLQEFANFSKENFGATAYCLLAVGAHLDKTSRLLRSSFRHFNR